MDATVIERLARLRGVGDAYHDYRGELRFFSLESKAAILRAMGSPVDDALALAEELRRLEDERYRALLPAVAASNSARIGVDLNISARDFGSSLMWAVNLERGGGTPGPIRRPTVPSCGAGRSAVHGSPAGGSSCRSSCLPGGTNWN